MLETCANWFSELDGFDERIPLDVLRHWLESHALTVDDIRPYLRFRADRYVRNLAYDGRAFQALVLCWRNGQRSPIHDHRGSSCGVRVLAGVATETIFQHAPNGLVYPVSSRELEVGDVTASQDADIHQMSNLQAGDADLVTLHLYSPPLLSMNMYSLIDAAVARFFDPVNDEFVSGAGI